MRKYSGALHDRMKIPLMDFFTDITLIQICHRSTQRLIWLDLVWLNKSVYIWIVQSGRSVDGVCSFKPVCFRGFRQSHALSGLSRLSYSLQRPSDRIHTAPGIHSQKTHTTWNHRHRVVLHTLLKTGIFQLSIIFSSTAFSFDYSLYLFGFHDDAVSQLHLEFMKRQTSLSVTSILGNVCLKQQNSPPKPFHSNIISFYFIIHPIKIHSIKLKVRVYLFRRWTEFMWPW